MTLRSDLEKPQVWMLVARYGDRRANINSLESIFKQVGWEEGLETWYLSSPRPGATLDISDIRQALQLCPELLRPGSGPNHYCSLVATSLSPKALNGVSTINIPFPKVGKLSPRDGHK